jgi:hypothetical protein
MSVDLDLMRNGITFVIVGRGGWWLRRSLYGLAILSIVAEKYYCHISGINMYWDRFGTYS